MIVFQIFYYNFWIVIATNLLFCLINGFRHILSLLANFGILGCLYFWLKLSLAIGNLYFGVSVFFLYEDLWEPRMPLIGLYYCLDRTYWCRYQDFIGFGVVSAFSQDLMSLPLIGLQDVEGLCLSQDFRMSDGEESLSVSGWEKKIKIWVLPKCSNFFFRKINLQWNPVHGTILLQT